MTEICDENIGRLSEIGRVNRYVACAVMCEKVWEQVQYIDNN